MNNNVMYACVRGVPNEEDKKKIEKFKRFLKKKSEEFNFKEN